MSNVVEAIDVKVEGTIWRFQMAEGTWGVDLVEWGWDSDFFMLVLPDGGSRGRMTAFFYPNEESALGDLVSYVTGNGVDLYETKVRWSLLTRAVARIDNGAEIETFGSFKLLDDDMVHFRTDCNANYKIERRVLEGLIA